MKQCRSALTIVQIFIQLKIYDGMAAGVEGLYHAKGMQIVRSVIFISPRRHALHIRGSLWVALLV